MPFTLAHAAAALPLRILLRKAAVFPALVIGCFIPDVPYFLPAPLCDINAHQWPAIALFGIPCGWAMYIAWFGLLLEPIAALLPRQWAALLVAARPRTLFAGHAGSGTLSLLAGAISHVAWDAFTHRRGLVVHAWPALARPALHVGDQALPPYFVLQHGSTVLGLLWLALHVRRRLREMPAAALVADATPPLRLQHKIAIATMLPAATAGLVVWTFASAHAPRLSAYSVVCCCISTGAALGVAYALAWHACRWRGTGSIDPPNFQDHELQNHSLRDRSRKGIDRPIRHRAPQHRSR